MANITVTFTITEFCLHTGVTEEELNEIVGLGVIEPYEDDNADWQFGRSRSERGTTRATLTRGAGARLAWDRGRVNAAGREFTAARRKPVTAATPFSLYLASLIHDKGNKPRVGFLPTPDLHAPGIIPECL